MFLLDSTEYLVWNHRIRFDRDESKLYVNGDERLYVPQDNLKKPMMALAKAVKEYLDQ